MAFLSKGINPKGVEIIYDEYFHRFYSTIDGERIRYLSVSTFIYKFFPEFDPDGTIAKNYALKNDMTVEAVHALWDRKKERSRIMGSHIHENVEDMLNGRPIRNEPSDERELSLMNVTEQLVDSLQKRLDIMGVESVVFDSDVALTGTIDLCGRSKKDGKLWIIDYKSSNRIDRVNKYNQFGFAPIQHLPNINYMHYSLQLNMYENLMKRAGYVDSDEPVGKALIHITENGRTTYVVDDLQKEINDMIESKRR